MFPTDWYWTVGGDTSTVYSSKRNIYVLPDDAAYVAWTQLNQQQAVPIGGEDEVWYYVQSFQPWWLWNGTVVSQPAEGQHSKDQLSNYAAEARRLKMAGDIVVNGLPFSTDPLTYSSLNSAYIYTQGNTGATFSWKLPDGSFITLAKADVDALLTCSNAFAQQCFTCEDTTLTSIEAGTITDLAAIDAAFAAINNVFTGLRADGVDVKKARHRKAK